jgi:hypothetical protein
MFLPAGLPALLSMTRSQVQERRSFGGTRDLAAPGPAGGEYTPEGGSECIAALPGVGVAPLVAAVCGTVKLADGEGGEPLVRLSSARWLSFLSATPHGAPYLRPEASPPVPPRV